AHRRESAGHRFGAGRAAPLHACTHSRRPRPDQRPEPPARNDSWPAAGPGRDTARLRVRTTVRVRRCAVHSTTPTPYRAGRRTGPRRLLAPAMTGLEITNVTTRYGRGRRMISAVDGVDLAVPPGAIVGLVGESGSGKSSLARAMVGLAPVSGGTITLDG